jgi:hypothetical protein
LVSPTLLTGSTDIGARLAPITVENRGNQAQRLQARFIPFTRTLLSGAPILDNTQRSAAIAVSPERFSLAPGEQQTIALRVRERPAAGFISGAVSILAPDRNPADSGPKKSGVNVRLANNLQINSLLFLSWPQAPQGRARLQEISFRTEGPALRPTVIFRGERGLVQPRGTIRIPGLDWSTTYGRGQTLIPGSAREMAGEKSVVLPPGQHRLEVWRGERRLGWRLLRIGPDGRRPQARGQIALRLSRQELLPEEDWQAQAEVKNNGNVPYLLQGSLAIYNQDNRVIQRVAIPGRALAPGQVWGQKFDFKAPGQPGLYQVVFQTREPRQQRATSLLVNAQRVSSAPSRWQRLRDWLGSEPILALALGAGIMAAIIAVLGALLALLALLRKRREANS